MSDIPPQDRYDTAPPPPNDHGYAPAAEVKKSKTGLILGLVIGGVVLLGGCCLVGGAAIMLPALGKAREAARQVQAMQEVRQISTGLMVYATDHDNRLPGPADDWQAALIDGGYVPAESFVSPDAEMVGVPSYFYVPASTITSDAGRVLIYEHPDLREGGGVVGFHDGSVRFVEDPEFGAMIDGLMLEDGSSWAPHEE